MRKPLFTPDCVNATALRAIHEEGIRISRPHNMATMPNPEDIVRAVKVWEWSTTPEDLKRTLGPSLTPGLHVFDNTLQLTVICIHGEPGECRRTIEFVGPYAAVAEHLGRGFPFNFSSRVTVFRGPISKLPIGGQVACRYIETIDLAAERPAPRQPVIANTPPPR